MFLNSKRMGFVRGSMHGESRARSGAQGGGSTKGTAVETGRVSRAEVPENIVLQKLEEHTIRGAVGRSHEAVESLGLKPVHWSRPCSPQSPLLEQSLP